MGLSEILLALALLFILQGESTGGMSLSERVPVYTIMVLSVVSNVLQFLNNRKESNDKLHASSIQSYEKAYTAQGLELSGELTRANKYKDELDKVSEELQTVIGIDMKYIMDLAREGLHIEIVGHKREIESLKRRLARYESEGIE
jgi:hypothetical protein